MTTTAITQTPTQMARQRRIDWTVALGLPGMPLLALAVGADVLVSGAWRWGGWVLAGVFALYVLAKTRMGPREQAPRPLQPIIPRPTTPTASTASVQNVLDHRENILLTKDAPESVFRYSCAAGTMTIGVAITSLAMSLSGRGRVQVVLERPSERRPEVVDGERWVYHSGPVGDGELAVHLRGVGMTEAHCDLTVSVPWREGAPGMIHTTRSS